MFRGSVRAAGFAALFGACVLCSPLGRAGDWHGWSPKKSQREKLHPSDCQFGFYGTGWRAWPEGCDRGVGCAGRFAPAMTTPMWSPSIAPMPTMSTLNWPIQPQPESPNPWSTLPPIPQMNSPRSGPQLPPPSYGPAPIWPQSVPATPAYPTLPPVPPATQPIPRNPAPSGQQTPVPPMPTTMGPASRGAASGVVPAGIWNRSVPATLSAPDFGQSTIQPMGYSAPQRSGSSVPKQLGGAQSPRNQGPVTLLVPEF